MSVNIPKFHGGIRVDSFLDWLMEVEEILKFQSMPEDELVSLVTTKFHGQAASWWRQVKKTRKKDGKNPIKPWDKLKKKLCTTFLPRNYELTMYCRSQNSTQIAPLVDAYEENCFAQVKDFVNKPLFDIYGSKPLTMKPLFNSLVDVCDGVDHHDQIQDDDDEFFVRKTEIVKRDAVGLAPIKTYHINSPRDYVTQNNNKEDDGVSLKFLTKE
ncbi:Disease resistance protein RBA1 [Cardamine amara subsp. amara]|uniref:Disease resistance protein RBA1 n=1 Tax=Cardamine amara subsp. amara TaxID=228776 RepID=A0ABD0ZRN0_CARAN